jgi:hypothetical protein
MIIAVFNDLWIIISVQYSVISDVPSNEQFIPYPLLYWALVCLGYMNTDIYPLAVKPLITAQSPYNEWPLYTITVKLGKHCKPIG